VDQDLADHDGIDDEANGSSSAIAFGTDKDIMQRNPLDQFGPGIVLRALLPWPSLCAASRIFIGAVSIRK